MEPHAMFSLFIGFGMCVIVPLGIVAGIVLLATKRARDRHDERMAMISQGILPPDVASAPRVAAADPPDAVRPRARNDSARGIGWAAGLVVAGVLWLAGANFGGIILTSLGAAYLTRGILGMRSRSGSAEGEVR